MISDKLTRIDTEFSDIANAIRNNYITPTTSQYTPNQLAPAITNMANDIKDTLYQYLPTKHSINGVCNNSVELPIKEGIIEGNSKQDGTPTPENPIDIEVINGSNLCVDNNEYTLGGTEPEITILDLGKDVTFGNVTFSFLLNNAKFTSGGNVIDFIKNDGTHQYRQATGHFNMPINEIFSGQYSYIVQNFTFRYIKIFRTSQAYVRWKQGSFKFQVTPTSVPKPYLQYGNIGLEQKNQDNTLSKTTPINLNGNELAKVGEVKDILRIYRSGKVEIEKKIGKVILNNSNTWNKTGNVYRTRVLTNNPNFITNRFITKISGYLQNGECHNTIGNYYNIEFYDDTIATLNDWINWITTHNIEMYYVLNTPEIIELPSIDPISTYDGTTIFNLISNLDTNFDIEYVESV